MREYNRIILLGRLAKYLKKARLAEGCPTKYGILLKNLCKILLTNLHVGPKFYSEIENL